MDRFASAYTPGMGDDSHFVVSRCCFQENRGLCWADTPRKMQHRLRICATSKLIRKNANILVHIRKSHQAFMRDVGR